MTEPSLFPAPTPTRTPIGTPTGKEPLPNWLLTRLERAGYIDIETRATARTRSTLCRKCWHGVMLGLTSFPTPWPALADPAPLTAEGEVLALLAGIKTFELRWIGDHYELERRDYYRIKNSPITTLKGADVLAEHHCRNPANWPTADTKLSDSLMAPHHIPAGHHTDDPPF